jgi:starch synthase
VYTIHNLALQGSFDDAFATKFGIGSDVLTVPAGVPLALAYSAMAQGIAQADRVNTVSDTYAKEILTPEYGAELDPLLRARAAVVSGIVNGIDYEEFDPATDPAIVQHYSADALDERIANKRALQSAAGLPLRDDALLFGVVTRLFAQKGIDLVAVAFDSMLATRDMQLAVLGTGDEDVHQMLLQLQQKYPERVKIWLDFDPPLGQRIYAGCDVFLMPSRYEPCGLGQLISLRYGAVPLVRRTGGLADTVQNADLPLRSGTGFVFDVANATELEHAAWRAQAAFENPDGWRALQERGMRQDWSWARAAGKYVELYESARADRAVAIEALA